LDFDDVITRNEFVLGVDDGTEAGVFTDGPSVEDMVGGINGGTVDIKSQNFESIRVNDGASDASNGTAGLDAEDRSADEFGIRD